MAHEDGKGFARVKVVTDTKKKDYVKVKQVDDPTIKNYIPVKETSSGDKDYKKVVVVDYDSPKDYLRVNFIDPVDPADPEVDEYDLNFNKRVYAKPAASINLTGSVTGSFKAVPATSLAYMFDGDAGPTRNYVLFKSSGDAIQFNTGLMQLFIDGVELESSETSLPTDSLWHEFEIRAKALINLSTIGAGNGNSLEFHSSMRDLLITGIVGEPFTELSIPLNEPYSDDHNLLDVNGNVIGYKVDDIETDYTLRS